MLEALFIPQEAGINDVIDELRVRGVPLVRFANTFPYKVSEVVGKRDSIRETVNRRWGDGMGGWGNGGWGDGEMGRWGDGGNGGMEDGINGMLLGRLDYLDVTKPKVKFYMTGVGISDTVTRYFQDAGLIALLPGLDICIQPFLKFGESDEYPIFFWHDVVGGDLRRAYGCMEFDRINILLGRESLRWGPLPGHSFILSGASPAFDLLYASYEYKLFKGTFFCTSLDPYILEDTFSVWWREEPFPEGTYKRFFSGHRLDFSLFDDKVLIGLSEVIMYSGEGANFISGYLNPFNFYWAYKRNRGTGNFTDNIGWGFDFSYYGKNGLCLYGELLVDDAQYAETEENFPNMLAYRMGLKGVRGKGFWSLQYARVDTWTYIHQLYWNDYLYLGYPIGHPKGQDFDEIYGRVVHHLNYNWDITLDFSLMRKGENGFDVLWPGVFPEHQKFPSGVVEKSTSVEAGFRFFNLPVLSAELVGGYTWIGNYRNKANETKWFPSIKLKFSRWLF